ADRGFRRGRHRDDRRRSRQPFPRAWRAAEARVGFGQGPFSHPIGKQAVGPNQDADMISALVPSAVVLQMWCVAGLLGMSVLAILLSRSKRSTAVVYGATLAICVAALLGSLR